MQLISLGSGKCSTFGGPSDIGVGTQEGLSCIEPSDLNEWWFRRIFQNPGSFHQSMGLARNLDPNAYYLAMRWGYTEFDGVRGEILQQYSREQIRRAAFMVSTVGVSPRWIVAQAADWGPNTNTGRLVDLAPAIASKLGFVTDDQVQVSVLI